MENLNVFVTGGTTALGRETTRQLSARGHKVTALTQGSRGAVLVRQDGGLPAFSDPFRAGEIKSLLIMSKADVILHLMPQIPNNFPHREAGWHDNARVLKEGTDAVLEAAQGAGVKFVVFPAYAQVYGNTHGAAVTEESELHTPSVLRPALDAEKRVLNSPVPACVLRAALNYGADDTGTLALKDALQNGRTIYLGDGHNVQSWVHVADLARAVVLAAEQQPAGQIFNIADNRPASLGEFASYLAGQMGVSAPTPLTGFALRMMSSASQRELADLSLRVNSDRAKSVLGWSPKYPDYHVGIEQTLLAWRADVPLPA